LIINGEKGCVGVFDDFGGVWEMEGMGEGLEERLEALLGAGVAVTGGISIPVH
jgi:hypothetical protein